MPDEPRRTILCVDDEQDVVDSLYDTLMDVYDVKTATSGEDALKIFNEEDISLVITDQRMPEMEGTELLARINETKPICKKILLTGYADINSAIDAINKGSVDRYFSKPWEDEELIKAVEALLAMYNIDEFFAKVIEDAKDMKGKAETAKGTREVIERFLDSCLTGICVVGDKDKVEYLNEKGKEILKYKESDDIKGMDFKEIFLMDEINKEGFWEKYLKKDLSHDRLNAKLGDGSTAIVQASLTFIAGEKGIQVAGIVFDRS
ncbi:MAG: response regulator [Desulfobacterales bacterium]|nr:response regulator [Desulfobacterales bacterium]